MHLDQYPNPELENLKARVAEAEDTLRAIYHQEVDALIMGGPDGDQVFTLQGAETSYRLLVEAMNEGALTLIPDGTILYCNSRFAEMIKAPMEQVVGSAWPQYFLPDEAPKIKRLMEASDSEGGKGEFTIQSADDSRLSVQISVRSLKLDGVEAFVVLVTDISELNLAHHALHLANEQLESRVAERTRELALANETLHTEMAERRAAELVALKLAAIVQSSDDAIVSKDLSGIITSWNEGAHRLFGYAAEEIIGQSINKLIAPGLWKEEEEILARLRRGERIYHYETIRIAKNGRSFPVSLTISPITDQEGRIIGASKIARDITEHKQAEQVLAEAKRQLQSHAEILEGQVRERTAKLLETIAELEAFSYTVSHDLRAPLRAVQSFSQILLEDCAGKLNPEELDYLRRVASSAKSLDRLIQDVLMYSRTARTDIILKSVSPGDLIHGIIRNNFSLQKPAAHVTIQGTLPQVLAEEGSLVQCVSNLLENAVKFVRPDLTPRVIISAEVLGDEARIWFEDNGIGIAAQNQERIFRIFERIHPAEKYAGTGIGLSIVKKAIERMGGKVGVESEPGKGSRFWIQLSRAKEI